MARIKINRAEDGVPIPPIRNEWKEFRARFELLKAGQSMLVSLDSPQKPTSIVNLRQALRSIINKTHRGQYVTRIEGNGIRIWKIEPAK
jgi:hypothetical protein